jgi:hypothetical protein
MRAISGCGGVFYARPDVALPADSTRAPPSAAAQCRASSRHRHGSTRYGYCPLPHACQGSVVRAGRILRPTASRHPVGAFENKIAHRRFLAPRVTSLSNSFNASSLATASSSSPVNAKETNGVPLQPHSSSQSVHVKLVGVGTRGAAALQKLFSQGGLDGAEVWCIDVDKHVLESVPFARGLVLGGVHASEGKDGQPVLSPQDLKAIVGQTASDADGQGNVGAADGGVAFVLAPAAAGPGGTQLLLQLSSALRSAGHFTVAALTAPFEFEGHAKAEQAALTVAALDETAHLVAVMEQNVLLQAFGESQLTVAEATDIADNALEHTARSVLQAVQAQEILKSSRGALMWHGRDLRHYKRLLSPPLQQLLTCPGTAVLGRGLAALPSGAAHSMGGAKALMHLASDAVLAASESPFLDGALDTASAVLCCINLPPIEQSFIKDTAGNAAPLGGLLTPEGERRATRMAAQAAAGALRSITGRSCDDFVLCVEPRPRREGTSVGAAVQVEATLLVLRAPNGSADDRNDNAQAQTIDRVSVFQPEVSKPEDSSVAHPPDGTAQPIAQQQQQQPPGAAGKQGGRLPSSNWSLLSAMAGGTRSNASNSRPQIDRDQSQQQQPSPVQSSQANAPERNGSMPPPTTKRTPVTPLQGTKKLLRQRDGDADVAEAGNRTTERVTVGDYLAESLTAQSLDLPPAAARWRQAQRADRLRQRRLIVWEVDETEPWEEEDDGAAGGLKALLLGRRGREERKVNLRDRVAGVLAQDREDAWDAESRDG